MTTSDAYNRVFVPEISPEATSLDAALQYADAGLFVLPVLRGTKNPGSVVGAGWQTKSSRDVEQICTWFAGTSHGIALHLGPSGLIVIDVDYPVTLNPRMQELLESSECPYQSTRKTDPRRGHYVFRLPPGVEGSSSPGALGNGWGDVRGGNAVIIVSPSEHSLPDGHYRWTRTGEVPPLPGWFETRLKFSSADVRDALDDDEVLQNIEAWGREHWYRELLATRLSGVLWQPGSRHDRCQKLLVDCIEDARVGAYPAETAIQAIYEAFIAAKPQEGRKSANEFRGMVRWAVAVVASKTRTERADHRDCLETELWLRSERGQNVVRAMMTGGVR